MIWGIVHPKKPLEPNVIQYEKYRKGIDVCSLKNGHYADISSFAMCGDLRIILDTFEILSETLAWISKLGHMRKLIKSLHNI